MGVGLSRNSAVFPSPLRGGVRGGGPAMGHGPRIKLRPPSPTLPLKGGGSRPSAWRHRPHQRHRLRQVPHIVPRQFEQHLVGPLREAWTAAYTLLATVMIEAAREATAVAKAA